MYRLARSEEENSNARCDGSLQVDIELTGQVLPDPPMEVQLWGIRAFAEGGWATSVRKNEVGRWPEIRLLDRQTGNEPW